MDKKEKLKLLSKKIGQFLYQIAVLLVIFYGGFLLFKQIRINYQTNQNIEQHQSEIQSIKIQNKNLENLLIYYQSDTFKELELRRRLSLKKPGETLLVMPGNKDQTMSDDEKISPIRNNDFIPNYQKWFNIIFKRSVEQ